MKQRPSVYLKHIAYVIVTVPIRQIYGMQSNTIEQIAELCLVNAVDAVDAVDARTRQSAT